MKRIVSLLLALVMICGLLPQGVMATETPDTAENLCNHEHDDSCYTAECTHVHGECGYVEENPEILCSHDCAQDTACGEKILTCLHVHDDSCGYAEHEGSTDSEVVITSDEEIGSGTPDSNPPVLYDVALSATSVMVPGEIEVIVKAEDDISGISLIQVGFYCEETNKSFTAEVFKTYLDGFDWVPYEDGKCHGTLTLNEYTENGVLKITSVSLRDKAGNSITYRGDDLPENIQNLSVEVTGNDAPDKTAPVLNDVTLSATSITIPGEIEVIVDATEEGSGISLIQVGFYCEETKKSFTAEVFRTYLDGFDWVPYEDGKCHGTLALNQYTENGVLKITSVSLRDKAGNSITYRENDLPENIKKLSLAVTGNNAPDKVAPVLNDITLSATRVTVPGEIEVIVDATEEGAGISLIQVGFYCEETKKSFTAEVFRTYLDGFDWVPYEDGKCHGTLKLNQYVESGILNITSVSLLDKAGNNSTYRGDDLPERVKTLQLQVSNLGADVITSVSNATFVEEVKKADNDAHIAADYSGDATMPKEAFDAIAGTDKTIDLISEGITWRFEGSDITEIRKDIDLKVEIQKVEDDSSASGDAIESSLNGNPGVVMKFPENGTLPGKATIQVKVDYAMREYLGTSDKLCVYYYNNQTGELELIADNLTVINDTYVEFPITHCSYYVLTTVADSGDKTVGGSCGDNLTWEFDKNIGTLTISGTGAMIECINSSPWKDYRYDIGTVVIGQGVTTIGAAAFDGFIYMESITIPDSVTQIDEYAFGECVGLRSITFDGNAPAFSEIIFNGVTATAYYPKNNPTWTSDVMQNHGGNITWVAVLPSDSCGDNLSWEFDETTKVLTISGTGPMRDFTMDGDWYLAKAIDTPWRDIQHKILEIVIESGVTTVGRGAFAGMEQLIVVSLPNTLTSIGDFAFHADTSLKALDIPGGVTYLGKYALCCCPNLVTVSLPDGITEITTSLFDQTWPNTITIPAGVTTVGSKAFAYGSVGEIVFTGKAPIFADDAFYNQTTTVRYPENNDTWTDAVKQNYGGNVTWVADDASINTPEIGTPAYTTDSGTWGSNLSWNLENNGVLTVSGSGAMMHYNDDPYWEEVGKYAWKDCADGITQLVVGEGITELNSAAFSSLKYLTAVTLPNSLTNLSTNVFADCVSLKNITMGSGVTEIGDGAFARCTTLEEITIPSNVKQIGQHAFDGCIKLKNVTIPEGVTVIWKQAFRGCTSLTTIDLPDSVESIGTSAFEGCTGLTEVTLPKNLLTLYGYVFYNCSNLKTLYFEGDVVDFHPYALLNLTATAYYPVNNPTWTASARKDYGGNITWATTALSGKCGDNLTWTFSGDTLTISGTGDMYDYSQDQTNPAPWTHLADNIGELVIEEGVTGIGDCAFINCSLGNASIPSTLTRVGDSAGMGFRAQINQTVRQWSQVQIGANNEYFPHWDVVTFVVEAPIVKSGKAGEKVYWELNENGTMEFFGTGDMYEFGATASPYAELSVKTVIISEGITNIGANIFESWGTAPLAQTFESITVASTVKRVEDMAFTDCKALKSITFTGDAPSFGENRFRGVTATAYYPAGNATWTNAVMQDYEGTITWEAYCPGHVFGDWVIEGNTSSRTCTLCGYTEHKVTTDSGNVEIEIPDQPDLEVEVDPVLPSEDSYILVEKAFDSVDNEDQAILKVFDINLKNADGVHVQPNGTVIVKLPLDWEKDGNYKVYRVNDDGTLTDMNAYRQGSHMVFETDHFSLYVIVEEGHQHDYQKIVTAPDCTENGFTTYTCGCGSSYVDDEVAALGHSYDKGKVTTKPTCMAEGVKTYTCGTCGDTKTEPVEKDPKNHSFTKYESDNNATCKKNGTKTAKCDHGCGKTDTVTDRGSKLGHKYQGDKCIRCGVTRWNPDTGDKIMIAVATMAVSAVALLVLFVWKKRK